MTPVEEKELFRILAGVLKLREWLQEKDRLNTAYLKNAGHDTFLRAQGRASILDELLTLIGK